MFNIFGNNHQWPIEEAKEAVMKGEGFFVDVREDFEVEVGHVQDAIWFPLGKLANDPQNIVESLKSSYGANKEYYIYCRSGNRSGQAQHILKDLGLSAHNVGGFNDLVQAELPVQTGIPTKVL